MMKVRITAVSNHDCFRKDNTRRQLWSALIRTSSHNGGVLERTGTTDTQEK